MPDRPVSPRIERPAGRHDDGYCRELREHLGEHRDTRRRLVVALVLVVLPAIATFATGNPDVTGFLLAVAGIVGGIAVINEMALSATRRRLVRDCPDPGG